MARPLSISSSLFVPGLLFALAATAQAGTLKVPAQFATIQAAVDAAAPGDRIVVAAGTYSENVLVPAGLDGLTLQGSGTGTILDARPQGVTGTGDGIGVNGSNGVTIRSFTVRNAAAGGVASFNTGIGIDVVGDGALVDKCVALGCSNVGIYVTGNGGRVQNCQLNGNDGGIEVDGSDALVTKCTVSNDTYQGIGVFGDTGTISKCRVTNIDTYGVWTEGTGDSIVSNTIGEGGQYPIWVQGDTPSVLKNTVNGCQWEQTGLYFNGGNGGLVSGNKFNQVPGNALYVYAENGLVVEKNVLTGCGIDGLAAIYVSADGNTFTGNTVTGSGFDALQVYGAGNTFTGNKISATVGIGIYVISGSGGTVLESNTVEGCTTEGLWNDGATTTADKNVFKGSRLDVTSSVAFAAFTGNTFTTGGENTLPEF